MGIQLKVSEMKTELTVFDDVSGEGVSCASVLKVLADETRLAVIQQLLSGPMHVGQINESLGVEQTLLSHHLRVLRDATLVTCERDGKHVVYSLAESIQGRGCGRAINLGCCLISFD
jgi:DNA-binding transcriptional ArsR family regulator